MLMIEIRAKRFHKDNGDENGQNPTINEPISPDGTPELGKRYQLPARQGRAVKLAQGQSIKIINTHGTQVCDTWAFSQQDLCEFMSWEHGRAWLDRIIPKAGDQLVTNHRRSILTLVQDTSPGIHDTLMAACDLYRFTTLGCETYHDNCADNLRMAMKAIDARIGEVPQPLNLWMNIPVRHDNSVGWLPPVSKPGDYVTLQAEMDCFIAMSACPQDIIPINGVECTPVDCHFEVHPVQ